MTAARHDARYVGADRRTCVALDGPQAGLGTLLALLLVPAMAGVGLDAGWRAFAAGGTEHFARSAVLLGAACALAVMASVVQFASFGQSGRAPDVWMAVAFALVAAWLVVDALPLVATSAAQVRSPALHSAAAVGPFLFGVRAVFGPTVDSRLSITRAAASLAVAVATAATAVTITAVVAPGVVVVATPLAGLAGGLALAILSRRRWRPSTSYHVFVLGCLVVTTAVTLSGGRERTSASTWPVPAAMLAAGVAIVGGLRTSSLRNAAQARTVLVDRLVAAGRDEAADAERARREERDHDLRSGLLAIEVAVAELGAAVGDEEETRRALSEVELETARLRRMLSSPSEPDDEVGDLHGVLSPVLLLERARGVDVHEDVAPDARPAVPPDVLVRVMHILLDNAREHAPGARVDVVAHRHGDRAEVIVRDDGCGLAHDEPSPPPDASGGREDVLHHGLGLLSARRLVEEHGGHFRVEHFDGGGMAFTVDLPAQPGGERMSLTGTVPAHAVRQIAASLSVRRAERPAADAVVLAGRRHTDHRFTREERSDPPRAGAA
jgi:signal transduction histidine kinase